MDGSANGPPGEDFWRELNELKLRVAAIERILPATSISTLPGQVPDVGPSVGSPESPERRAAAPFAANDGQGQPSALESRIGAQLFNRVGIFAVLAAAAWFLKLAIDRAWIRPGLRVALGLLAAAGLAAWSERFRRGGAVAFSYTLKALASGIAYLSLWACFSLYRLLPAGAVFAAMVAVTVANAALAWRQNAELLAALALAGGLATPALLATGGDQETFLFSYLLLLDVAALALLAFRPWPRLAIGAFAGTTVYLAVWWFQYYTPTDEWRTGVFIALFFTLFTAAPFLVFRERAPGARLLSGFPVAVGVCGFVEADRLLAGTAGATVASGVAAALGLIYLALAALRAEDTVTRFARTLRSVHLGLAVGFFALAGLLRFHGYGIALSWLGELIVAAAGAAALRGGELGRPLRASAAALLPLSFCALLLLEEYDRQQAEASAFLNAHFATYLAGLAIFAGVAALSRRRSGGELAENSGLRRVSIDSWTFLAAFAIVAFNFIALLAVGLQIDLYWRDQLQAASRGPSGFHYPAYVDFTYSAWFMIYGAALMAAGFLRRSAFLRWQALLLLTLSVAKVFLFDTSHLHEGYRVASFLGLGVLLLAVSFAYQRDWLDLRSRG